MEMRLCSFYKELTFATFPLGFSLVFYYYFKHILIHYSNTKIYIFHNYMFEKEACRNMNLFHPALKRIVYNLYSITTEDKCMGRWTNVDYSGIIVLMFSW